MSLSVTRELGQALVAFAEEHSVPVSHVASCGIRAVLSGVVELTHAKDSHDLAVETWRRRGEPGRTLPVAQRPELSREELDARCAARDAARKRRDEKLEIDARVAAAPADAGLSRFVAIPVSQATASLVDDQLERAAHEGVTLTDGEVFDGAISRMLDQVGVEVAAGALCATCLESDLCRCNGQRRAVGG
jgi:hypothetical protein